MGFSPFICNDAGGCQGAKNLLQNKEEIFHSSHFSFGDVMKRKGYIFNLRHVVQRRFNKQSVSSSFSNANPHKLAMEALRKLKLGRQVILVMPNTLARSRLTSEVIRG